MTVQTPRQGGKPPESTVKRFLSMFAIFGALATIIGVLNQIWSWIPLPTKSAKVFALVGIVLLAIFIARLYSSPKGRKPTWRVVGDWACVGGICVCATLAAVDHMPTPVNPTEHMPTLRFVQAAGLHECQVYYGTGSRPRGYEILIFDSPSPNGPYYFDGEAIPQGQGGWKTPLVQTGNDPTYISAVLVAPSSADFVDGIYPTSDKPEVRAESQSLGLTWLARKLPPGLESIPPLEVEPPLDGSACPP
jgi:hypothetical protein